MRSIVRVTSISDSSVCRKYFSPDLVSSGLRSRALKGASVTVIAQGAAFAIQTIGTLILARLLTPNDFGIVAMVLTISMLLGNFGINGFTEAIIQMKDVNHEQISALFWINMGISILLAAFFIAATPVIVWFYKEPRLASIVLALAASNILAALSVQHLALLKRGMRFSIISANEVIASFVSILIPIILALWGWGYWALVAKWVISPLSITLGAWLICEWKPGFPTRGAKVGHLLKYAYNTYGNFIMSYLRRNLDKILIGRALGSQPLGYYDRAYQLSNMLPVQITNSLYAVAVSAFSKLTDDPARYRQTFLKVLSMLAFVSMPLGAALTVTSHDVMLLLLGPQWNKAGEIFFAFGLSIGVSILYITHGWLHLSLGTPDRWFRWSILEFIVTALCFLAGLPFGPLGVAFAFSASFYILIGPALWYAGKPIQLKAASVLSRTWRYYVAALLAGSACWSILYSSGFGAEFFLCINIFARISIAFVFCISLYLALIILLYGGMRPLMEFATIVGEIISKTPSEN